jgi:hypothetical protein
MVRDTENNDEIKLLLNGGTNPPITREDHLIAESARRYAHFRKAIRKICEKETKLGSDTGMVR